MRWPSFCLIAGALVAPAAGHAAPDGTRGAASGVQDAAVPGPISIVQPWTTAAGKGGTVALYMTLVNRGTVRDDVVSARCAVADSLEIDAPGPSDSQPAAPGSHRVDGIPLFPDQRVVLGPDGYRVMLHGLHQALAPHDLLACALTMQKSGERLIEVSVLPAGSPPPPLAPVTP